MRWTSIERAAPLYIWHDDTWYNETDKQEYSADIDKRLWVNHERSIPWPPKTRVMSEIH